MTEEKEFSRGDKVSGAQVLRARVQAELAAALDQATAQLAEAPWPSDWEVFAVGPYQDPDLAPGRIIELGQTAYIVTIVWLNPFMNANVAAFAGKVQLNYFTSNMQTMEPVADMVHSCCFSPAATVGDDTGSFYISVWELIPTQAACILETNICARLCNCDDEVVPGYAAFVRWVDDLDIDNFFAQDGRTFDHPIRYLVYDNNDDSNCECDVDCVEGELPPDALPLP